MVKLFGQFLVEKQLISEDELLEALVNQLKSTPSTAEVVYDRELLAKTDQLKILAHQQSSGLDYRSSANQLGLWNEKLSLLVSNEIQKVRRPLGEVLVNLGRLTGESLFKALNEYVEACSLLVTVSSQRQNEKSEKRNETVSFDPVLCEEYVENLEGKILPNLRKLISDASSKDISKTGFEDILRNLTSTLSALKAAAQFLGAKKTMQLANDVLSTINGLRKVSRSFPSQEFIDFLNFALHAFDALGELIKQFHSEDGLESDSNLHDIFGRLQSLNGKLGTIIKSNTVA